MADKNESGNAQTPEPNTSSDVSVTPSDAPETASPPQTKGKRKLPRTTLSLREKAIVKSFCEQKVTDSKARGELVPSQELLRREVAAQFGFNCGRSTLSKIMSMDWRLLRGGHEGGDAPRNTNMKRRRRPRFPDFEADLVKFIEGHLGVPTQSNSGSVVSDAVKAGTNDVEMAGAEDGAEAGSSTQPSVDNQLQSGAASTGSDEQQTGSRRPLTEAIILEEAQRLKQVHGVTDGELVLSVGWLARFKTRNGICLRKPAGEGSKLQLKSSLGEGTPGSGSIGAWSASLMAASTAQMTVLSGDAIHGRPPPATSETVTGNEGVPDLLPPGQSSSKVEGATGDVTLAATKKAMLCSAQWHPAELAKGSLVTGALLDKVPESIRSVSCSCQASGTDNDLVPDMTGLRVVVVGFGSVVKAFLAAALVGAGGFVTCVEASPSNVMVAEQVAESYCLGTLGLPLVNMQFIVGEYGGASEPVPPSKTSGNNVLKDLQGEADVVVCNCSIQSLEFPVSKNAILELAFSLLKVGGELRLTDLVSSRRLTSAECEDARAIAASAEASAATSGSTRQLELQLLLGAPYIGDLRRLYRTLSSDIDIRSLSCSEAESAAIDVAIASLLPSVGATGDVRFRRVTFRLYRLQDPEHPREDYGQTAVFHGGDMEKEVMDVENTALSYQLDDEFSFQKGECVAIDSNTAQILSTSWLRSFFSVSGDCSRHRGPFIPVRTHTASTSLLFSLSSDSAAVVQPVPSQTSESATSESGRIEMVDI